jgi:hypothetical protein
MAIGRRFGIGWLVCWLALRAGGAPARADDLLRVPVIFHVAPLEHGLPEGFVATQIEHANVIFRPLGFELVDAGRAPLAARHARLVTRADRDALLPYVRRGALHCMLVASLMDVDEPGRERRGVHWRGRGTPRHLVIVSASAGPYVLAHELGHFFGNREHSDTPGNLMSYDWTRGVPFLDPAQQQRVRASLQRMLGSGELKAR